MSGSERRRYDTLSIDSSMSGTISICCTCKLRPCKKYWCSFNGYWLLVLLFIAMDFYLLLGGALFSVVEGPHEQSQIKQVQVARTEAKQNLTELLLNLTTLTNEEVQELTEVIIQLGEKASKRLPEEHRLKWDYWSAFFFASTVITTIGYGTLAPSTPAGQVFCMLYAIVGIPLALAFLGHLGSIISKFIHAILVPVKQRRGYMTSQAVGMTILFLITLVVFIIIPGAIFSYIETWNIRESVYYAVISLTTVGFGDYVPAQAGSQSSNILIYLYKFLSATWLWLGLALVWSLLTEFQTLVQTVGKRFYTHKCCGLNTMTSTEWLELEELNPTEEQFEDSDSTASDVENATGSHHLTESVSLDLRDDHYDYHVPLIKQFEKNCTK